MYRNTPHYKLNFNSMLIWTFQAINEIAWSNAHTDSRPLSRFDPNFHFESEQFDGSQHVLMSLYNIIINSVLKDDVFTYARDLLGAALHGVQVIISRYMKSCMVKWHNWNVFWIITMLIYLEILHVYTKDNCTDAHYFMLFVYDFLMVLACFRRL